MKNIDTVSVIKKDKLDEKNYFKSLIEQAVLNQLLTDNDMVRIQFQILQLLENIVYKYNGLESTSIRKEILEDISNSIYYTINVYLKNFTNPDMAVKVIQEKGIDAIYAEGRKKINRMLDIIRVMYAKVKQTRIKTENQTYNDTIMKGIKGFLKIYNPEFEAQDMKITADYPLYNNLVGKLEGVEFIQRFLEYIYLENYFCNKFSAEKIRYLLYGYSSDYKELIINIFEIVLLETLACKLANRDIHDLIISEAELLNIYNMFNNSNIDNTIEIAYNELKNEMFPKNEELQRYIEKNLNSIKSIIKNAFQQRNLDKIFITQKFIIE